MMDRATAVIMNAGLGDLTLGLTQEGFRVEAIYEEDAEAAFIHQTNFDIPISLCLPQGEAVQEVPQADLLAARLNLFLGHRAEPSPSLCSFLEVLHRRRPQAFMALLGLSSTTGDHFKLLMDETAKIGYCTSWSVADTAKITGFPVRERKAVLVGVLEPGEKVSDFQWREASAASPPDLFLQAGRQVDPWYFQVRHSEGIPLREDVRFYCWKDHGYVGTDRVGWNHWNIPLVRDGDALRKITHREIANLKGFPSDYILPEGKKSQLYRKLMYSGNVLVIRQAAEHVLRALENRPWPGQLMALRFDDLFGRYIEAEDRMTLAPWDGPGPRPDFVVEYNGTRLLIETKCYSTVTAPEHRLADACEELRRVSGEGSRVLAVANKVPAEIKTQFWKDCRIRVWDVANLLWLFDGHDEIKKEFIAQLGYSVQAIKPVPPSSKLFQKTPPSPRKSAPDWAKRLAQIAPDKDHAVDFEKFCVEILKSTLNEYLTLWRTQERSNNGLYRFDLCCKIKLSVARDIDFFDTIQQYFNTKYIVFEFKNYSKPITQKEIYTTEKYLYEKALRKVAVIIARKGADDHAQQAARGCLRESGKLILCLSAEDLLRMADLKERGDQEPVDVLGAKLDDLLIDLDK